MDKLTNRQAEVLTFIVDFISEQGFPPTYVEMADHFGMYPYAAQCHMKALIAKGYIEKLEHKARGIRVV